MKRLFLLFSAMFLYANSPANEALELAKLDDFLKSLNKCSNYDYKACNNLENYTFNLESKIINSYMQTLCDSKNKAACYFISASKADAKSDLFSLCKDNFHLACTSVVIRYSKDINDALSVLNAQCLSDKNYHSCYESAKIYSSILDSENTIKYSSKSCVKNSFAACRLQAQALEQANKDKDSLRLYDKTCSKKDFYSCIKLFNFYKAQNNTKYMVKYLKEACNIKDFQACSLLK